MSLRRIMFRLCHRLWSGGDPPGVDKFRVVSPVIFWYPGSSALGGSCIVPHWVL